MQYKGFAGAVEFDADNKVLHGRVLGIRDVVTFEAESANDVEREFRASVDDYLAFCRSENVSPQRPASGKLALRIDPALHRDITVFAESERVSVNSFIEGMLSAGVQHYRQATAGNPAKSDRRSRPGGSKGPATVVGRGRKSGRHA